VEQLARLDAAAWQRQGEQEGCGPDRAGGPAAPDDRARPRPRTKVVDLLEAIAPGTGEIDALRAFGGSACLTEAA
jgi:hypothetical protein